MKAWRGEKNPPLSEDKGGIESATTLGCRIDKAANRCKVTAPWSAFTAGGAFYRDPCTLQFPCRNNRTGEPEGVIMGPIFIEPDSQPMPLTRGL